MGRRRASAWVLLVLGLAVSCGKDGAYGRRPDWKLRLPDGKEVRAPDYDGKVLIVDFWATWCPPCRREIPAFIALKKEYGDRGLEILGFSLDQDPGAHDRFVRDSGMNYLSLFASSGEAREVVRLFEEAVGEIQGIPTTLVIDRGGRIVHKHVGYAPREEFERLIRPLLGAP